VADLPQPRAHVVEFSDQHGALGLPHLVDRTAGGRRIQHVESARALQKGIEADRQQRPAGMGGAGHRPRRTRAHQQPVVEWLRAGIGRDVELDRLAVHQDEVLAVPEGDAAVDPVAPYARLALGIGANADVGGLSFVHRGGRRQWGAALPALDHARVAGRRHAAGTEVGADPNRVEIEPVDVLLGFGQHEAVLDEGLVDQVELALHGGVGAAARQRQHAAAVWLRRRGGSQAVAALEHPVLVLGLSQRVQIEHHFPRRRWLAVLGERGPAPQAARIGGVAPEVVVVLAHARDHRNALARVQHLEQAAAQWLEPGIGGKLLFGEGVLRSHPAEGLVARDIFEPKVRIVGGNGFGLSGVDHDGKGGQQERGDSAEGSGTHRGLR
jgi:hypothetical protein